LRRSAVYLEERQSESQSEYDERKHCPIARCFDGVCGHYAYDPLAKPRDIRGRGRSCCGVAAQGRDRGWVHTKPGKQRRNNDESGGGN